MPSQGKFSWLNLLALLFGIVGASYELFFKHKLATLGVNRVLEPRGNTRCRQVTELPACEKSVLHEPSGLLYLACSTLSSRVHWTPAIDHLNATGASRDDYVATYQSKTNTVTRLKIVNFSSSRGLSLHGMDVVPSEIDPSELFVYLVNHRAPLGDADAAKVGADSVIEVFKTTVGGSTLTHIKTVEDPVIITPNDIAGSSDGKSFYFTNDHGAKVGLSRILELFGLARTSVGYCHLDKGCHFAIENIHAANGIVKAPNGTIYVGNAGVGGLYVLSQEETHTLTLQEFIPTDRPMDNLSVDQDGHVWAAGFPRALQLVFKHFRNPSIPSASSALRFSQNADPDAGDRGIKVEKVFEDDGSVASGITTVTHDAHRGLLYLTGLASPHLTVCNI